MLTKKCSKIIIFDFYSRSSLAKIEMEAKKSGNAALWIDFSDIFNSRSGRRTANSDTYVINELKIEKNSDTDDDQDVTMIPESEYPVKIRSKSISNGSSGYKSGEEDFVGTVRRRSSVLETLKKFICLGHQ